MITTISTSRIFLLICGILVTAGCAWATSNYQYGSDEYDAVINGISPDGKLAITSHGGGEDGYDNFHLYLTDVATRRNISVLKEVAETLDTGAEAFAAKWSSDSKHVTIVYRTDRHEPLKAVSYNIGGQRPRIGKGPINLGEHDALVKYWAKYGSGAQKSPKKFRIPPLKQD
jgi:Tol biopolymer transport system component